MATTISEVRTVPTPVPTSTPSAIRPTWSFTKLLNAIKHNQITTLKVHHTHLLATLKGTVTAHHQLWHVVQAYLPPWPLTNFQSTLSAHHVIVDVIAKTAPTTTSSGLGIFGTMAIIGIFSIPVGFAILLMLKFGNSHSGIGSFSSSNQQRGASEYSKTNTGDLHLAPTADNNQGGATTIAAPTKRKRFFRRTAPIQTASPQVNKEPAPAVVTFADVGGIDEVKSELEEIVDLLKNPEKYRKVNAKIPKGTLLVGAPGTGKTLCARAVAGEAGVNFLAAVGSQFVELYVGKGAQNIRATFKKARDNAPCILFIDELDAVGKRRKGSVGSNDEYDHALNQLLTELDGFQRDDGVIIMAATNRADILDEALTRPGRFDRQVMVHAPDIKGREKILAIHSSNTPLDKDVSLADWAKRTTGFVGASLANLVNEAAIFAARKGHDKVSKEAFQQAFHKSLMGPVRNIFISDEDKERTAHHEAGHALMAVLTPGSDPLSGASILPRGMSLGVTISKPERDKHTMVFSEMVAKILMALGGRVAEEIRYASDISTGPSDDMAKASKMVRQMVYSFGMSDFGVVNYEALDRGHAESGMIGRAISEETARDIDNHVKKLMDEYLGQTRQQLTLHK
ncbi:MAG: ATP-dependent metallopeptidase FtsH/Yme1/Tma family protein, partial [Candidatus Saccharimonadales bacterium]